MNFREEYMRCFKDETRVYFIENYLKTFDATQNKDVPFKVFPRQKVFLDDILHYNNVVAIKPRQSGITTVTSAWATGQMVFASKSSPETILCIGNKLDISEQLVTKIGAFLDQVPRWMWGSEFYSPNPDDPKNTKDIYVKRNKDEIKLFNGSRVVARSSGDNAARGISAASIVIFDEAAFIERGPVVYAQAVATTASLTGNKKAKIVMVSTPNGKDQLYYRTYSQALKGENNFHATEFRWYQDPRYNKYLKWYRQNKDSGETEWFNETILDNKGSVTYDEKHWRKMVSEGWTPTSPWYENMCKTFNNDDIKINQELNVSFLGSSDNVVSPEVIEMHQKLNVIDLPSDWELGDPFIKETWIWKKPVEGHRYICAADTSSGSADDFTAIQIIDIDAMDEKGNPCYEQVLEYNGKLTGDSVGGLIDGYARQYNNALVVVEDIGGYGSAAILTLLALEYPNMYYDDPALKTPTIQKKYSDYNIKEDEKLPGFHSNAARFPMISNFVQLLRNNIFKVRSKRVIGELETWIFKNGRPDHMAGAHDDLLTCLAMGLYVMEFYYLKADVTRKQNTAMLKAWTLNANKPKTVNPDKFNNFDIKGREREPVSFFYSVESQTIGQQKRINAMLLMAGFRPK